LPRSEHTKRPLEYQKRHEVVMGCVRASHRFAQKAAENEVLRDEGEAYGRKLTEAGVKVTAVRCLQTIHDFAMLNPIAGW
jgi:acetyl esterase/lipase